MKHWEPRTEAVLIETINTVGQPEDEMVKDSIPLDPHRYSNRDVDRRPKQSGVASESKKDEEMTGSKELEPSSPNPPQPDHSMDLDIPETCVENTYTLPSLEGLSFTKNRPFRAQEPMASGWIPDSFYTPERQNIHDSSVSGDERMRSADEPLRKVESTIQVSFETPLGSRVAHSLSISEQQQPVDDRAIGDEYAHLLREVAAMEFVPDSQEDC
jgi:hypothetical protein